VSSPVPPATVVAVSVVVAASKLKTAPFPTFYTINFHEIALLGVIRAINEQSDSRVCLSSDKKI